ncbi:hypothetical protein DMENIID0001_156000 [Sergentomyia squamirostris]
MDENTVCNISPASPEGRNLRDADIILWDECSMVDSFACTAVNNILKRLMGGDGGGNSAMLFGGKVMVMGGDFRQILPVVKHGDRTDVVGRSIVNHSTWSQFTRHRLQVNQRAFGQEDFANFLLEIGEGGNINERGLIDLAENDCVGNEMDLINRVFGFDGNNRNHQLPNDSAILCPRHDACRHINTLVNNLIDAPERVYLATNSPLENRDENNQSTGRQIYLPRLNIVCTESEESPVEFTRRQFPVIYSFAMTINKSQGQTLNRVGLYLSAPVFSHGHLYVAVSRVRSRENFSVVVSHGELGVECTHRQTKNIVFEEIITAMNNQNRQ